MLKNAHLTANHPRIKLFYACSVKNIYWDLRGFDYRLTIN